MSHSSGSVAPSEGWERSISAAIQPRKLVRIVWLWFVNSLDTTSISPPGGRPCASAMRGARYSRVQPIIGASAETHVDRKSPPQIAASTIELHCTVNHSPTVQSQPKIHVPLG